MPLRQGHCQAADPAENRKLEAHLPAGGSYLSHVKTSQVTCVDLFVLTFASDGLSPSSSQIVLHVLNRFPILSLMDAASALGQVIRLGMAGYRSLKDDDQFYARFIRYVRLSDYTCEVPWF